MKGAISGAVSRRQLLAWTGGTALALVLGGRVHAAGPVSLEDFMALSGRLLEQPATSLSPSFAQRYLSALVSSGSGDALTRLGKDAASLDLENRIIGQWYTGLAPEPGGPEVVTYTEAMMWGALDFTKPMGWCGGETGYWADAPEGEA